MKLDVNTLGTFYRMAHEGAGLAAGRLTRMAGVDTQVGVTKLNFMRGSEIRRDFDDGVEKVGIRVDLTGGIEGHSLVVFDRRSAVQIVASRSYRWRVTSSARPAATSRRLALSAGSGTRSIHAFAAAGNASFHRPRSGNRAPSATADANCRRL